ncbi:MAG TPA: bifunctional DNA primase/polymerase, partial [Hyphomicrobium sp.]|nr:bifunctional DNA primase/polymerase [Hyphomicrobium sp.]
RSNISVHTGKSNLVVVDIDNKQELDKKGFLKPNGFVTAAEHQRAGRLFPPTAHVRTKSGGLHLYYRITKPFPQQHKKKLGPGIDLLAGNFGAILPPSTIDASEAGPGGKYEWVTAPFRNNIPLLPRWVFEVTKPAPLPKFSGKKAEGDVEGRIIGALRKIEFAPGSEANITLNKQAHFIGRLVAQGLVTQEQVEARLLEAALKRGQGMHEARATIRSGLRAGMRAQGGGI